MSIANLGNIFFCFLTTGLYETRVTENNFLGYVPFKWPPKNGYLRFKIKKLDDDTFSGDYDILCFGLPTSSDPREHKMPIIRTRKSKRRIRIHTSTANTNNKGIVDLEFDADTYHTI